MPVIMAAASMPPLIGITDCPTRGAVLGLPPTPLRRSHTGLDSTMMAETTMTEGRSGNPGATSGPAR